MNIEDFLVKNREKIVEICTWNTRFDDETYFKSEEIVKHLNEHFVVIPDAYRFENNHERICLVNDNGDEIPLLDYEVKPDFLYHSLEYFHKYGR